MVGWDKIYRRIKDITDHILRMGGMKKPAVSDPFPSFPSFPSLLPPRLSRCFLFRLCSPQSMARQLRQEMWELWKEQPFSVDDTCAICRKEDARRNIFRCDECGIYFHGLCLKRKVDSKYVQLMRSDGGIWRCWWCKTWVECKTMILCAFPCHDDFDTWDELFPEL